MLIDFQHAQGARYGKGQLLLVLLLSALTLAAASAAEPLVGRASVVDGDTIELSKQRVRLNGIDAPETAQICQDRAGVDYRCGQVAAKALDEWLARSRPTRCVRVGYDTYDRIVADCFRNDGLSVQKWLVRRGYALDWPRYSNGAYVADQAAAKSAKSGIWQGQFGLPWEFRASEGSSGVAASKVVAAPNTCSIKGNISQDGKRIYHVPGQE